MSNIHMKSISKKVSFDQSFEHGKVGAVTDVLYESSRGKTKEMNLFICFMLI